MKKLTKRIISKRIVILAVLGALVFIASHYYNISTLEPAKFSLYKPEKLKSGDNYSCSKCLKCVAVCPNGSLTYNV